MPKVVRQPSESCLTVENTDGTKRELADPTRFDETE
jgi:hypothetical protein